MRAQQVTRYGRFEARDIREIEQSTGIDENSSYPPGTRQSSDGEKKITL